MEKQAKGEGGLLYEQVVAASALLELARRGRELRVHGVDLSNEGMFWFDGNRSDRKKSRNPSAVFVLAQLSVLGNQLCVIVWLVIMWGDRT